MFISEIFHSIQGEGSLTGVPSVFVRTSGCNLRCAWCDTPYASWTPEGAELGLDEVLKQVSEFPSRHVVLTGGEPMMAKGVRELARALVDQGKHLTIETNATILPDGVACSLASLSPKLKNSLPPEGSAPGLRESHEKQRIQLDVIRAWVAHGAFQLKFAVSSNEDVEEVLRLLENLNVDILPDQVILMPEGVTAQVLDERGKFLVEACKKHGFRFGDRLHVRLYGQKRGV